MNNSASTDQTTGSKHEAACPAFLHALFLVADQRSVKPALTCLDTCLWEARAASRSKPHLPWRMLMRSMCGIKEQASPVLRRAC